MKLAIVGCGFVADYYARALPLHPELELIGVTDRDPTRAKKFAACHSVPVYASLQEMLADRRVEMIVNLTNPDSHYAVSKVALEAGRHVYTEKPISTRLEEAVELVELAERRGLQISSAPCSLLGESAQTIWKTLRENVVGPVRLVYAEIDDGMVHRMPYRKWISESGAVWPARDEFEVGCTLEHAAYYLSWFPAWFGPATTVSAFASCLIPEKQTDVPLEQAAADFSVACIRFTSGVVARLTCSIIAPHDHSLRITGDDGVIEADDCWDYLSPVRVRRRMNILRRTIMSPWPRRRRLVRADSPRPPRLGAQRMDFCRGIADMAEAISHGRPPCLSARYCLHVNEIVLAIHNAIDGAGPYKVTTTFDAVRPMAWVER